MSDGRKNESLLPCLGLAIINVRCKGRERRSRRNFEDAD